MADQELGIRMKTTSDVPDAMGKAKTATVSFQKQLEDIQKKFSTSFKDILLGVAGPMIIFNSLIDAIKGDIEKAKQDAKEGLDLIAKGDTAFASSQQKRQASFVQYRIAQQEEEQKVRLGAQKIYEEFLNTREGQGIYGKYLPQFSGPEGEATIFTISEMAKSQKVRDEIEAWFKANQSKLDIPGKEGKSPTSSFTAPQGVNAVVGMGNNAAMDAMNAQLEEQRKQTMLLSQIAGSQSFTPPDFTKPTVAAPSRSYLLTK